MKVTVRYYCPEFSRHLDPGYCNENADMLNCPIDSGCGEAIKKLVDAARLVPIDPQSAGDFWYAIMHSACIFYYG